jgi:hypothetical protein
MVSATVWGTAVLSSWLLGAAAHPMHTSVTEIVQEEDGRSVRIGMRLFADDLEEAIGTPTDGAGSDSLISAYVRRRFVIAYEAGSQVLLQWDGAELVGDVLRVRLRAAAPQGLAGVRLTNSVLCERFEDQVNVVRATYDGRAATLIFTRGDPAKPLR